jgi:hypothetical protein
VLLAVSRRVARIMRPLDTVARLAGDQFAVILASEGAAGKIAETAEQIRKALKSPFNFGERDLSLTASIGVTIYDGNPATADDVLRDAELAIITPAPGRRPHQPIGRPPGPYRLFKASEDLVAVCAMAGAGAVPADRGYHAGTIAGCGRCWTHPQRGNVEFVPWRSAPA